LSPIVSIIIPCLNEKDNIEPLYHKITAQFTSKYRPEIIFIDDGSTDGTLQKIKQLAASNPCIKFISFSKNFGHQIAIKAGLDYATGACAITMDADLQHPSSIIPEMLKTWENGFKIVQSKRSNKNTSVGKKITASLFYKIINSLSDINLQQGSADFRLLDRSVIKVAKNFTEQDLFWRGLTSWMGFKTKTIGYDPEDRLHGQTKYPFKQMLKFAISGITSFSVKPLRIAIYLGLVLAFLSLIYAAYAISLFVFTNEPVQGWTSLLVSILFIGGLQLFILGVIGEYLGKLFMQSKSRPLYIIQEQNLHAQNQ